LRDLVEEATKPPPQKTKKKKTERWGRFEQSQVPWEDSFPCQAKKGRRWGECGLIDENGS
jgi:hypothetical protein